MSDIDWNLYTDFSKWEFDCSHTGENEMQKEFMDKLQAMRNAAGFQFDINSGYRARTHPVEARKSKAGEHTYGQAADIAATHVQALWLIENARKFGFTRIGVKQSGLGRFIHLGDRTQGFLSPALWSY